MFLKRFIPKKKRFIRRSCHSFIPKIKGFLKINWSMNQHLYYQFLHRKYGVIVFIFPEMVKMCLEMRKNGKCDYLQMQYKAPINIFEKNLTKYISLEWVS